MGIGYILDELLMGTNIVAYKHEISQADDFGKELYANELEEVRHEWLLVKTLPSKEI